MRGLRLVFICFVLASCEKVERAKADLGLYSTDVHVEIAQHTLVLPFISLEDHAYRKMSFSLNRKGDREHAQEERTKFLRDSADPKHPLAVDDLSVVVRTYGWDDGGHIQPDKLCPLLSREWARSVCDNPWAGIQQALPVNRFRLVDLSRLTIGDSRGHAPCVEGEPRRALPKKPGETVLVCAAVTTGQHAVVRIDGDLGALWEVWSHDGETAEAIAKREGEAITAFVKYGIGSSEDFPALHDAHCRLRRPQSVDGPQSPDCKRAPLTGSAQNPN